MSPVGSYNIQKYQHYQPNTDIDQQTTTTMQSSASSFKQSSPGASKMTYNELQVTNPLNYATSPLSDSLLLALRRSRPNTRLFRALFQYIPIRDSPNENPHLELPLQSGDYVLVHGQMDEDQFYFGELLNGKTGLVPSNYVERVPDHVLLQNASRAPSPVSGGLRSSSLTNLACCEPSTSSVGCAGATNFNSFRTATVSAGGTIQPGFIPFSEQLPSTSSSMHIPINNSSSISGGGGGGDGRSIWYQSSTLQRPESPSFALNVPFHHTQILHDFTDSQFAPLPDSVCPYPPVDVSKVTVQEMKQPDQPRVPFPRELTVEKKLSRSAVISWLPPEDKLIVVSQYHICADGVVKAVVPGAYKCKALIEDLNLDKCVNISVRAVTEHGHSHDAACTVALGTEAPVAPQHVRVSLITPISACLSWYPSNSNAEHVILLNAIKVGVCPPSVFQVQLHGLSPSTIYRVSVRTKHPKAVLEQRPVERCVDFKTLPKIGLPDPPSQVQVEVGPQPGTLLISWKPVTSQPKPPSRAAVHSYLVFADGRNIAQVPSATADHVLLRLADFADDPPIFITVRTRTREGAISADSNVVRVPRGISATNPNVLSSREQLPFSSSIAVNTATGPLTTTSLPNSLIGNVVGSQPHHSEFLQSAMNTIAMPYGMQQTSGLSAGSAPSGLLTTLSQHQQQQSMGTQQQQLHQLHHPQAMHPQIYNTAYPMTQSAMLPSTQTAAAAAAANAAIYGVGQPSGTLLNGATNAAKLADWKQQQQSAATAAAAAAAAAAAVAAHQQQSQAQQQNQPSSQYYTFHPKSLFKEFTGADDKPSVLEMENNYLLKHRQQQREREMVGMDRWTGTIGGGGSSTLNRYDYYGNPTAGVRGTARYDDYATGMSTGGRPMIMAGGRKPTAIPPRLSRVRSEELLGTRSEPDLRPLAITDDDENCRLFVALFDYDHLMSPNPNAQQEELSFRKHQLIKVYGDVDADGFYRGQIGRRFGLVPSNMVIEIAKDDFMPQRRRSDAYPVEPAIRRMRWGSLKSRSYDHAGDRRRRGILPGATYNTPSHAHMGGPSVIPGAPMYSSLDRREHSLPPYRYYDRSTYEGPPQQPASARSYGATPRSTYGYGYTAAREYPHRGGGVGVGELHSYDQPSGPEIYEGGPAATRDYRRGGGAGGGVGDDYGRDTYHWDYANEQRDMRESRDYRYDHPPYEDERYPPPVQQRSALRRDYQRYNEQQQQQPPQVPGQWGGMRDPYDIQAQQPPQQQQQPRYGAPPQQLQQHQQQQPPMLDDKLSRLNGEPQQVRKLVAKYDYDPKICSPNPDAEQVELTFRQGDMITVYGEMDDDLFYLGELNGVKGMVPSNFLTVPGASQLAAPPNAMSHQQSLNQPQSIMVGSGGGPVEMPQNVQRPKGVAFSETTKKPIPTRQSSQTSNKISTTGTMATATGAAGSSTAMASKVPKTSTAGAAGKTLAKKSSDLGQKTAAATAARKSSQAAKKVEGKKK